ncbi:Uu.00g125050.m01.CDS01 [Anthostomella pinea]|uniref:Uu.00g125050.m01.CDS01 n=1 Tax=Anthostomella pinea TaxID=933095 RepID=A0AAI8VID8_9PEZI|nr:Uu.00g125050.m01.CDS01 [Anthostomella pinea]
MAPELLDNPDDLRLYAVDTSEDLDDLIDAAYNTDPMAKKVVKALLIQSLWPKTVKRFMRVSFGDCELRDGRVFYHNKLFIPANDHLRSQIEYCTHALPASDHQGEAKTAELIKRHYWWPGLYREIGGFVGACHTCRRAKGLKESLQGLLHSLTVPFRPWASISVDYITGLPECSRHGVVYKHIFVEDHELYANTRRGDAPKYKIGDLVWLSSENIVTQRPSKKLSDKWLGPFAVSRTYKRACALELDRRFNGIFPVFHHSLLRPVEEPRTREQAEINKDSQDDQEGLIIVLDKRGRMQRKWIFDKVTNSRMHQKEGLQYYVEWQDGTASWQPARNLQGCHWILYEFHRNNKGKPGPPGWYRKKEALE